MNTDATIFASRAILSIAASISVEETAVQASAYATAAMDKVVAESNADSVKDVDIQLDTTGYFEDGIKRAGTDEIMGFLANKRPCVILTGFTKIVIPEFGIEIPAHGATIAELHRAIFREFLRLEDRAKRDVLLPSERKHWLAMSKYFDYARYREETAPLVKVGGLLVSRDATGVVVRWHGGKDGTHHIEGHLCSQFDLVDPGENFSAMVRFVDGSLSAIDNVRPDQEFDSEFDDLTWIG